MLSDADHPSRRPVWAAPLAAFAAGLVIVVVVGYGVVRSIEPEPSPTSVPPTTELPPGGPTSATTRPPGTCVRTEFDDSDVFDPVPVPRIVPCSEPHDVEVLAVLPSAVPDPDGACAAVAAAVQVPDRPGGPIAHRTGTAPIAPNLGDLQLSDQLVLECLLVTDPVTGSASAGGFTSLRPAG